MNLVVKICAGGLVTTVLILGCWLIWDQLPIYLRGTVFWDFRTLVRVLTIFLLLTLVEVIVIKVWQRIFPEN